MSEAEPACVKAPPVRAVFFDCTPYMAEFFDAPARALVPELELRVARPAAPEVIEALRRPCTSRRS